MSNAIKISKAKNGFIIQPVGTYGDNGEPEIVNDLGGVINAITFLFVIAPEKEKTDRLLKDKGLLEEIE